MAVQNKEDKLYFLYFPVGIVFFLGMVGFGMFADDTEIGQKYNSCSAIFKILALTHFIFTPLVVSTYKAIKGGHFEFGNLFVWAVAIGLYIYVIG